MIEKGELVEVVVERPGSNVVGDLVLGEVVVPIDKVDDFAPAGKCSILGVAYDYTLDKTAATLTVDPPLTTAVSDADPVLALTAAGADRSVRLAVVDLYGDDSEPVRARVPTGLRRYFPLGVAEPGQMVQVEPTDSDDGDEEGYRVLTHPDIDVPIDLEHSVERSLPLEGVRFTDPLNYCRDPHMRDLGTWKAASGSPQIVPVAAGIDGDADTVMRLKADGTTAQDIREPKFPVTPGDEFDAAPWLHHNASSPAPTAGTVYVSMYFYDGAGNPLAGTVGNLATMSATSVGSAWAVAHGEVTVPPKAKLAELALRTSGNVNAGVMFDFDRVRLQKKITALDVGALEGETITGVIVQGGRVVGAVVEGGEVIGSTITGPLIQTDEEPDVGMKLAGGLRAYAGGVKTLDFSATGDSVWFAENDGAVFAYINPSGFGSGGIGGVSFPGNGMVSALALEIYDSEGITPLFGDKVRLNGSVVERGRAVPMGEWQTYAPVVTNFVSAAAPGDISRYMLVGKTCRVQYRGTIPSYGLPTGRMEVSLPLPASTNQPSSDIPIGDAVALDAGTARLTGATRLLGSNFAFLRDSSLSFFGVGIPHAWAAGDTLSFTAEYEIA